MDQESDALRFLCRPASFLVPDRIVDPPSWLGHVSFAFWIMDVLRPRVLVELGTRPGNSYSAFCQAAQTLGAPVACHAVACHGVACCGDDGVHEDLAAWHDQRYAAFSRLMRMTAEQAAEHFADGAVDLLHIDGTPAYDAARRVFETWLPKMSSRGVVLLYGVNADGGGGVRRLWDEVAAGYPNIAFLHSGGLGVLGAGDDPPGDLRRLFAATAAGGGDLKTIRDFFERQGRLAIQTATIDKLSKSQRRLEAEVARLTTENVEKDQAIAEQQEAVRRYRSLMEAMGVAALRKASRSARLLEQAKAQLQRLYYSRRHDVALEPLRDVIVADGDFESVGDAPALRLRVENGAVPGGWCVLSYRVVHSSAPLVPSLHVDDGSGFSKLRTIRLSAEGADLVQLLALLPQQVADLRFDPTNRRARFAVADFSIREIGRVNLLTACLRRKNWRPLRALIYLRQHGWAATKQRILQELMPIHRLSDYDSWIKLFDQLNDEDVAAIRADIERLPAQPLISIVMPAYNTRSEHLRRAVDTVRGQLYENWELCVVDDGSPQPHVAQILADYAAGDARIKFVRREENGHIAAASNTALELATGEFVALMDHDDELPPHALYMVAKELAAHPDADILYSDEDKIDENGKRYDPYFKSDYNPDLLCGQNMVSHLGVFRRSLLSDLGGFRLGYEGSQDYDLTLRAAERTDSSRIRHIPMILYHWRVFSSSSSFSANALPTAVKAARRALQDHFDRRGVAAAVVPAPGAEWYSRVVYPLPAEPPLVSLIIPTRDRVDLLRQCVEGMLRETDYPNLEVLVLDNGSEESKTLEYFAGLAGNPQVKVLRYPGPFNYSAINNYGVSQAKGLVIGLINNDIKVIEPGWLSEMVRHALRPEVGAVGAKLYYGDDTIQHAGVVTGICGVANHVFKHLPRNHSGYFGNLKLTRNFSCVTAACLLMRKSVFEEVGGLDEKHLAVAFNDVDLCLRVRETGRLVVWTPFAELYHLESASRGPDTALSKIHRFMREIDYMGKRWGEALQRDPYYNPNLTLDTEDYSLAFPPRIVKPWHSKQSA